MLTNIALSVVEQIKGKSLLEMKEFGKDDTEEKNKTEKETEIEKEFCSDFKHNIDNIDALLRTNTRKSLIFAKEHHISEAFLSLPDQPPRA
jgi:hypothetical protein